MSKITIAFVAILTSMLSFAQTNVGSGSLTGKNIPIEAFFGYSYSQSVYLSSEINASGSITGVRYYVSSGTSLTDDSYQWVVSIGTTTRTDFSGTSDWEAVSTFTQVYSDSAYVTSDPNGDYVEILFSSPFVYNGTDNLIISVEETMSGYGASSDEFLCSGTTNDRSITYYNDTDPQDLTSLFAANGVRDAVPNITFLGISPSCPPIDGLIFNSLTSSSFDVLIDETSFSAPSYEIEYGTSGFTPGSGTTQIITGDSLGLTNLTSETTYDFYVRAICGSGDTSVLFGPASLTTPCVAATPSFTEDFSAYLPGCWEEKTGLLTSSTTLSGSSSLWAANSGEPRVNIFSTGIDEWLISPSIDLSGGTYSLNFKVRATEYSSSTTDAVWGVDDSLVVVISTDNGITWSKNNTLAVYDAANNPGVAGMSPWIDLSAYTGIVRIGFYATSTVSNEDIYVYVDDFTIGQPPACLAVSNVDLNSVTSSSFDVIIDDPAMTGNYEVEYGLDGFTTGTSAGTRAYISGDSLALTTLMSNTEYDVYVRAICGVGDTSAQFGPVSVTTDCGIYTPVYNEDFASYLPGCWEEQKGVLNGSSVLTGTSSAWAASLGKARIQLAGVTKEDWLITPSFDLSAGNNFMKFNIVARESSSASDDAIWGADDSVVVVISADNGLTWDVANALEVFDGSNNPGAAGMDKWYDLSAYTGTVKIGFYGATTVSNENIYVYIDDFFVGPAPSCITPTSMSVSNVTNMSADVTWTTYGNTGNDVQIAVVEAGQAFSTADLTVVSGPATTSTLNGLMSNTDYEVYIRQICGAGDTSDWTVNEVEFTTDCDTYGIGYTEDFSSYIPSCWYEGKGILTASSVLANGSSWTDDNFGNASGGSDCAKINIYGTSREEWLISPSIDVSAGNVQVSFDMIATEWNSTTTATWGADDSLAIVVSTDNGATWSSANIEKVFTAVNPIDANGERVTINLSAYAANNTVRLGFYGKSDVYNGDIDVFVDSLAIEEIPDVTPSLTGITTVYCDLTTINDNFYIVNNSLTNAVDVAYEIFVDGVSLATGTEDVPAEDSVMVSVGPLTPVIGAHTVNVVTTLDGDTDASNDSQTVTVYISNPTVSAAVTDILCNGDLNGEIALTTVDAIGNVDYSWSANANGATTTTISALGADMYTGYVVDSVGCIDSVEVTLVDPALIDVTMDSIFDALCYQDATGEIYVTATGGTAPLTYLWDNGDVTEDITTGVEAGDYALTVTDANGCTFTSADFTVGEPSELLVTVTDNLNGTATADVTGGTSPYAYSWDNGDQTQTQTTVQLGLQTVTVTDMNGCMVTGSVTTVVGLDDADPLKAVLVYPNPTADVLKIDLTAINNVALDVQFIDNTGRVVYTNLQVQNQILQINTSDLAKGIYSLHLTNGQISKTVRVVVQ